MSIENSSNRTFSDLVRESKNSIIKGGENIWQFAQSNPGMTAAAVALLHTLFTNKQNRGGINNPLLTGGITYSLLKAAPFISNLGNLVNNANYATLEAQALMAKGNHLADTVPSAPLFFGRRKAMQKIQRDAINKGNKIFIDAYNKYKQQGVLNSNYRPDQIEDIKRELRNIG